MKSILVVDDNLTSLKQISAQLSGIYEVSLAKSGELALQICAEEPPDLILLDVEMAVMDGYETISRLKNDIALSQIPVIFLTGGSESTTEVKCLESGAVDFITKPANTQILLHRIKLHLEYSEYQHNLENTIRELSDSIGISFAEIVEYKDTNISGHLIRTGIYTELLTNELLKSGVFGNELKDGDVDLLRRASIFHDIGKIGVSDLLLLKRGPLTEKEYAEVQKHTIIGGKMLRHIFSRTPDQNYFETAAILAEGHHERYDGKGYPAGLKGEDISLHCRIISVANDYDSWVTDKNYRTSLSHEMVCRLIHDKSGTNFDPRIVDVFEKIQDKFASLQINSSFLPHYHNLEVLP